MKQTSESLNVKATDMSLMNGQYPKRSTKVFIQNLNDTQLKHPKQSTVYTNLQKTARFQAKIAAEIFEQLNFLTTGTVGEEEIQSIIFRCPEQSRQLAVYGFIQAKKQEREAKDMALKALRLPNSLKHLEFTEEEDQRSINAFDPQFLQQLEEANSSKDSCNKPVTTEDEDMSVVDFVEDSTPEVTQGEPMDTAEDLFLEEASNEGERMGVNTTTTTTTATTTAAVAATTTNQPQQ
ncbi:hypothetical protein INT47_006552 [Mucor saturninus]|uniref:Uncharacterized protein n=1 Tax=Mucor saturninus TaxID=64648 RepID=A0A8H7V2J5_9FUNG|nr:hypothetical protein INT47_006552 [Mucor saturninus]